jgi:hypothetical protein
LLNQDDPLTLSLALQEELTFSVQTSISSGAITGNSETC